MRIIDNPSWVQSISVGVIVMHQSHSREREFDSHALINWLNVHDNAVLIALVANYRITGQGKQAINPVHTATREIGKFIERELGQVKDRDHQSVRNDINLMGGRVHPGDDCENSVWRINAATTSGAQQGMQPRTGRIAVVDLDDLKALDLD